MEDCWDITIGGYEAIVDQNGLIIKCHSRLKKIKYESISSIFNGYKNQVEFKKIKKIRYPLIVAEDIYKEMVKKNPVLEILKKKFDCEIY